MSVSYRQRALKAAAHQSPEKYIKDPTPPPSKDEDKGKRFCREKYLTSSPIKNENQTPQKPKRFMPYDLSKSSPRIWKLRHINTYKEFDIEQILLESNIDFKQCMIENDYLPLEAFNDSCWDFFDDQDIASRIQIESEGLPAQIIVKVSDKEYKWQRGTVVSYDSKKCKFNVKPYKAGGDQLIEVPRLFMICSFEDPFRYCQKLVTAFNLRTYMDSMLRYNYYVDNIPVHDMDGLPEEREHRIQEMAINSKKMNACDPNQLLNEVTSLYIRTMNKIIFDIYLQEHAEDIFKQPLVLPDEEVPQIPAFGKIQLDSWLGLKEIVVIGISGVEWSKPKSFDTVKEEYLEFSLTSTKEAVKVMRELERSCQETIQQDFFLTSIMNTVKIEDFKYQQDTYQEKQLRTIRDSWPNSLCEMIIRELKITKGKSQCIDDGKLQRLLGLVRRKLVDVLFSVIRRNYFNFYKYLDNLIPVNVTIKSTSEVNNVYQLEEHQQQSEREQAKNEIKEQVKEALKIQSEQLAGKGDNKLSLASKLQACFEVVLEKNPIPLFEMKIITLDNRFVYQTEPKIFHSLFVNYFEKTLHEFQSITDPEEKIIPCYSKMTFYLRTPKKPEQKPREPDPNGRGEDRCEDENQWVWDLWVKYEQCLNKGLRPLDEYLELFRQFDPILQMDPDMIGKQWNDQENPKDIQDIRGEIVLQYQKEADLRKRLPDYVQVSFFHINIKEIREYLCKKYQDTAENLKKIIAERAKQMTLDLFQDFVQMHTLLQTDPTDIEQLTQIKEFISSLPLEMEKKVMDIQKNMEIYDIMEEFMYRFTKEEDQRKWKLFNQPKITLEMMHARLEFLDRERQRFLDQQMLEQGKFKLAIEQMEKKIRTFHSNINMDEHEDVARKAEDMNQGLQKMQEQARKINSREQLFEREITDYGRVGQLMKDFSPYYNLWTTADNWFKYIDKWLSAEWENLDAIFCEKFVEDGCKTLAGCMRFFKEKEIISVMRIAEKVKKQVDEFRPKVPLMVSLKKQGMYARHWQRISDTVGFPVKPEPGFTFQKVLNLGLMKSLELCVDVGECASKEYQIEQMLQGMKKKWEGINLELMPFKTISYIIKGADEVQAQLDEHLVNTQAMQYSPFKKPFEDEIVQWNGTLKLMSDILEEWLKVQIQWMYLQPIFDSPDIAKQLPAESKKFKSVDQIWRKTMNMAKEKVNMVKICTEAQLLERMRESNEKLEQIQKELNNYLEKKRERFARFYFLSNDDLLEILSQTKEPTAVQPHLKKVFENIHAIEFDEKKLIHAMFSAEREKIDFVSVVNPNGKNVEDWMDEVEIMMQKSVRNELLKSIKKYPETLRSTWVISHPGQCVLNGSQVHWTSEVESAIRDHIVKKYFMKLEVQLNELVELVRKKLTKQQQVTINALIVLDVHAKDVVERLVQNFVEDVGAFEWISQLRYYWENDNCAVKCVQTNFPYGYEYLGNTLRLVITPLTDKCYMTLMGALKLNLGGAPAGPAGTGKTESTKDLAKALAKQCVVFNCSDSMDYIMVGKFFKGLASAGAWCCFDEFNRINIEVLSVIAQQLLVLFREKAAGSTACEFEGSHIKMQPTFSVFITMNPGYAGRTELPDNLKALFRSVAMMVPDYAMIGEIMLYSFGFKLGRALAKKMVATFKLSSEQLSSQDHYDYGMRAVRSVINAAGLLKVASPDMDEEQLLLRALRDVNVPKFLKDDIPLFESIISDLFPGVARPNYEYGDLLDSIQQQTLKAGLRPVKQFIEKVLQLYDTIQVRHGLMLVGPTGGGKTSNYVILQRAMTALEKKGGGQFTKVNTRILNPKSITMGQLYGQFNDQTHEWTDGILAYLIRETVKDQSPDRHWVVFDGPVDSLWIESMNTVLDDNKKLCLNSGQILTLTPQMTMMFEVEDLAVASPATVSRCGMVYLEPISLGIQPLVDSWLETRLSESVKTKKTLMATLKKLFEAYLEPCLEFVRRSCHEIVQSINNNLAKSLMNILSCFFDLYRDTEYKKVSPEEIEILENSVESMFLFALIWSAGATGDEESRDKFSIYLRYLMQNNKSSNFILKPQQQQVQQPQQQQQEVNTGAEGAAADVVDGGARASSQMQTVYDFYYNEKARQWESWSVLFQDFAVDQKAQYHEIVIPTTDSTRNIFMTKLLLSNNFFVMCPGPTGTGKSLNLQKLLVSGLPAETFQYISLAFSAQTSANQTQDTIDGKLDKRRKGHYGPPIGKKCVIFIDDLNMPKKEEFGAQPPIELLRQYADHRGWYNRKDLQFMHLEDLLLLTAMGPPGGGRTFITNRMTRHFNLIVYTDLIATTIKQIYSALANHFLHKFADPVIAVIGEIVNSCMSVYERVRRELLPTPSKQHYTFNLRDIAKVFQGICTASAKHILEVPEVLRLWFHENLRVYHDRLTTEEDREYLRRLLCEHFETRFQRSKSEVLPDDYRVVFGDFMVGREGDNRPYYQVPSLQELLKKMEEFQEDFNQEVGSSSKKAMHLVLFLDACEHIARIARILRQPLGNALLLGVGGSGRQSLSKLACFISAYKMFQIEVVKGYSIKNWRDDVKEMLLKAGLDNTPVAFLFVDTQIIYDQMCEDLNAVLNSGDVTNIYNEQDMEAIMDRCKTECTKKNIQPNKMNIFTQYLQRVKNNIHVIIAMSPLGEAFTTRIRRFPSFVNCCTIDWFTEWPEEALIGVGTGQLRDFEQELGITELSASLVQMFKIIHKSVEKISVNYLQQLRRHNYVTPTSFLELLTMYKSILRQKQQNQKQQIARLQNGLDKLAAANTATVELQKQLKEMQPQLEAASAETELVMAKLTVDTKAAEEAQTVVAAEEVVAKQQEAEAKALADQAEAAVSDANKILDATMQEVQKLKKEHLVEVRALPNPPKALKVVLGGLVIMNFDTIRKAGGNIIMKNVEGQFGKKEEDYFETAKRYLLNDTKELLDLLKNYDKDNINPQVIRNLETKIMIDPDFCLDRAKTCSYAIQFLYQWCKAMYDYNKVYLETQPLRDKLQDTQKVLADKTAYLNAKKASLEKIQTAIRSMEKEFAEKTQLKEELTFKINQCRIQLERAIKLTSGLSSEQKRWSIEVDSLIDGTQYLPGNAVIAAGMVAYAGPFTSHFRQELEQGWVKQLVLHEIKHTNKITMRAFLGVPVTIQAWNIAGLPKDDTSTENGIIIDNARRWPLMIDPQTQANKFIKNIGKEHAEGVEIAKASSPTLMRTIELAVQFGKYVLIEGIGVALDPSLEPILLQQVVKTGSSLSITIGDKTLSYSEQFKLFMTTTIPNPHYPPETFVKVTIINFAITPSGLEEQMLAQIVALENPQLEQKKLDIVIKNAADRKQLLVIEDSILQELSSIKGGISEVLRDETLIEKLQNSKRFAEEINKRVEESKITEAQIDQAREGYRPVAFSSSWLFFCILDLCLVDPMYQYSLQWFMNLFVMAIENSDVSNVLEERLDNLDRYFTYSLYENVLRSLFEKHKLLFSLMLTIKILQGKNQISASEWRYFLAGPSGDIKIKDNPTKWISENQWPDMYRQLYGMDHLECLKGFEDQFITSPHLFRRIFDSQSPHEESLPEPWNDKLDDFQKMIVLKTIRPDKVINAIQNWIAKIMGKQFIIAPPFELQKCFKDSSVATALIFVLSPGSDPVADFMRFANEQGMQKSFQTISLGQGQGPHAEHMIHEQIQKGGWVLLQNCHLASSWMNELERLSEELTNEGINPAFRLWLTSMPSVTFPISVLQNGVKMTLEPPSGLRNNLLRTYNNLDASEFDECKKPEAFQKLLFSFGLFHAIIQDRRKFGPIGWNIPYEFTNEDLTVCRRQLHMLLDEYADVPYKVLNFLGAEINYGGRVTDDKDVRLIKTILKLYICPEALQDGYKFSESGTYIQPKVLSSAEASHENYIKYISDLPLNPDPEAFGLHSNAEITNAQNMTRTMLETILSVQPRATTGQGKSREEQIEDIASFVQTKTPQPFDYEAIYKQYPTSYEESMNTVLVQEVIRYNRLLVIMLETLSNVKKALKGLVVMSEELEKLANSLFDNQVPKLWADRGFLSLKPLASWTEDLNNRINFLQTWINEGTPKVFWISGFFFPQAFITGTLQNYARKHIIAIDKLSFEFKMLDDITHHDVKNRPDDGCYIYGMFLEGAKWNPQSHMIEDPMPKELYSDLPLMHLIPVADRIAPELGIYNCPLYKVVSRAGTLSTTGHSTNFVMFMELVTVRNEDVWIRAGVAAFLSLRY